jgi:hypothetical protein
MHEETERVRLRLGKVTIAGGAIEVLAEAGQHATTFLTRHACGDWGNHGRFDQVELTDDELRRGWEATAGSGKINKSNLIKRHDRVMSEYTTSGGRALWGIITSLDRRGGTTVLLAEDY